MQCKQFSSQAMGKKSIRIVYNNLQAYNSPEELELVHICVHPLKNELLTPSKKEQTFVPKAALYASSILRPLSIPNH